MEYVGILVVAIVIALFVLAYTLKLQRRAVARQSDIVEDHFAEKAQRQRQFSLVEESLELQKRAYAHAEEGLETQKRALLHDEEVRQLLRRSVELQEETINVLREMRK